MSEHAKSKRGRPPLQRGGARRVLVSLDDATIAKACDIGGGKLSPGIREAVRRCKLRRKA